MEEKIVIVLNEMSEYLSITQMKKLQEVIIKTFADNEASKVEISNEEFLKMFLDAKRIEGCSERTIIYYQATVKHLLSQITTEVRKITTEEIREYLSKYQKWNNCSNVTIDNVRRNISSFFSWLEEEDYILKSPMKRIHKIKTKTVVKSVISDEGIEKLRDNCNEKRDLAIIDLLYSTGIRVGELVNLNIDDIDLEGRECIVYGKGDKERRVYFDAKAKVHLKEYIDNRTDKAINTKHLACLTPNTEIVDSYFLVNAFQIHPLIRHQLESQCKGAIMDGLNLTIIKGLKFKLPPIKLQRKFVEFYNQVDKSKVVA